MRLPSLPFPARLGDFYRSRFDSRTANNFEFETAYFHPAARIQIRFFVPCAPHRIKLLVHGTGPAGFDCENLEYENGDDRTDVDFVVRRQAVPEGVAFTLLPARILPARQVNIALQKATEELSGMVTVMLPKAEPPDVRLMLDAHRLANGGHLEHAIEKLHRYRSQFTRDNPNVAVCLSDWYERMNDMPSAERFAFLSFLLGGDPEATAYRRLSNQRDWTDIPRIRAWQEESQDWRLESLPGLVALHQARDVVVTRQGHYRIRRVDLFELRRAVAARMLRSLPFHFGEHEEQLLHTRLRVIHPDDRTEEISPEHFRVVDQSDANVFIATQEQKDGQWILPNLTVGDVIERSYDLAVHAPRSDGNPMVFGMVSIFHETLATLSADCRIAVPPDGSVRVLPVNTEAECATVRRKRDHVHRMLGARFVPACQTGISSENERLNPHVAFAGARRDWGEVANYLHTRFFSPTPEEVRDLPDPLRTVLEAHDDASRALETAFYWVRDRIKYASLVSGKRRVGKPGRARDVVAAGVGDCDDKTHLLSLVCRRMDIPYQLLLVPSQRGVIVEQLPSDQFDHVFLRARLDDRWLYMDASNSLSVYGSPPPPFQGERALVLDDTGSIETIEADPPSFNLLRLRETFHRQNRGRLEGTFEIEATGHPARLLSEQWKLCSLKQEDHRLAGQQALTSCLDGALVTDWNARSYASDGGQFLVTGRHARCPLAGLRDSSRKIGVLAWSPPFLPVPLWRQTRLQRIFRFLVPMVVEIDLALERPILDEFQEHSRPEALDAGFCSLEETEEHLRDVWHARRRIEIRKTFLAEEEIRRLPEALDRIEEALQLVLCVRAD